MKNGNIQTNKGLDTSVPPTHPPPRLEDKIMMLMK